MFEELSPELFTYELYDSSGPMLELDDIVKYSVGWCDAGRLQVRPRSGLLALMVEFPDEKIWFHIDQKMLDLIMKRRGMKNTEQKD